jgi:hypothetical protein
MSGDRYVDCPRCKDYVEKFDAEIKGFLKTYYGKIDADEYEILRKRLKKLDNPFAQGNSVRLDYEALFNDIGQFEFYAHANCGVCGLKAYHSGSAVTTNQSESQSIYEEEMRRLRDNLGLPEAV